MSARMNETRKALDLLLRASEGGPNAVDAALTEVDEWEARMADRERQLEDEWTKRQSAETERDRLREIKEQAGYAREVLDSALGDKQ